MNCKAQITIDNILGDDLCDVVARTGELFKEHASIGTEVRFTSGRVDDDNDPATSTLGVEVTATSESLKDYFEEEELEDNLNELGFRSYLESLLENVCSISEDAKFDIEDIDIEEDDDEDDEDDEDFDDEDDGNNDN